ncbi:SDR family oxidoreductase [Microbacterium aerolatum]|uniref:SDR family NAD(P)-dependent oxidoreductase n=1 Tax=Microbacterium aerolatum TaxID=153731 RepID=UPI00384C0B81
MEFNGEAILITGGSGGMGVAMARRLARSGARVTLCDLFPDAIDRAVAELADEGVEVIGVTADTTDEESMRAAVATVVDRWGALYGLITAAGIRQTAAGFMDLDLADFEKIYAVNVRGTFVALRAAAPELIKSKGAAVTIASVTADGARMNQSAYCSSKAAVLNLSKQVALELAGDGVRVNVLCPGVTMTPMIEQAMRTDGPNLLKEKVGGSLEAFRPGIPLGRLAEPDEQAAAVEFLLSPKASFITGTAVYVDGGVSMLV